MRALLGETFRLLAAHLNLFTLISLTVWFPGHVLRNYFEFFEPEDGAGQSMLATLAILVVFEPLVGRKVVIVANLQPATLMGVESNGMVLAASLDGKAVLCTFDGEVPPGTRIK